MFVSKTEDCYENAQFIDYTSFLFCTADPNSTSVIFNVIYYINVCLLVGL